jgi:phage virion morphogenesis protein
MENIIVEVDSKRLQSMLKRLSDTCSDDTLDGALRAIGERLVQTTRGRIMQGVTPDGERFKPLSPVTLKIRRSKDRTGTRPLIDTGGLAEAKGGLHYDVTSDGLVIQAFRQGAHAHQFGAKGAGRGRKVTIPRRRFLGVSNDDLDVIARIVRVTLARVRRGELS